MKSRKYPTFEDAISDLESKGTLTYWGWEGQTNGYYIYTFKIGVEIFGLAIFKDGRVEIRNYGSAAIPLSGFGRIEGKSKEENK